MSLDTWMVDGGLELLDEYECRRLLATRRIGRIGLTVNGLPVVFPVNYRLVGDGVVFATSEGLKLDAARAGSVVAFEVDEADEDARTGWSVLAVGVAGELAAPTTQLQVAMDPWPAGERAHLVHIANEMISGRRIAPHE